MSRINMTAASVPRCACNFPFTANGDREVSRCNLWIADLADGRNVVQVSQLQGQRVSITDAAAELATFVCHEFGIRPERVVWVEHYPSEAPGIAPRWDMVTFRLEQVRRYSWLPGPGCGCDCCRAGRRVLSPASWRFIEPAWRPMTRYEFFELGSVCPPEVL